MINNYRDYEQDREVSKNTIVVLLGKKFGLGMFLLVMISTLLIPFLVPSAWPTIFLLPVGIYSFIRLPKALTAKITIRCLLLLLLQFWVILCVCCLDI